MHARLKRVRRIVPEFDQVSNDISGSVRVIDAGWLECNFQRWHGDVLGERLDNARHVRSRMSGKDTFGRHSGGRVLWSSRRHQSAAGLIHRVDADKHFPRPELRDRCILVMQHLRTTEIVLPYRRIVQSLPYQYFESCIPLHTYGTSKAIAAGVL